MCRLLSSVFFQSFYTLDYTKGIHIKSSRRARNSHLCLLYSSFSASTELQPHCVAPSHVNDLSGFTWINQVEGETYARMVQWYSEKL